MSTIRVNAIQNTSGVEVYTAKAWVNFKGTGTVAIRASGNVSSITDNGTSRYTVNFTTAMPDANYGVQVTGTYVYGTGTNNASFAGSVAVNVSSYTSGTSYSATYNNKTTGAVELYFTLPYDAFDANIAIFR